MDNRKKISNTHCFFTTWKSSVGAGAYAVPYLFYQASPFIGFVIFTVTVIVTCYTSLLMIDAHDAILKVLNTNNIQQHNHKTKTITIKDDTVLLSYADVSGIILGPVGYYLSFWSMVIGMWGSCTAYVIFLKQNIYTFIIQNQNEIELNQQWIPIILFPLFVTTLFFRNIKRLSIINILGILSLLIIIFIVFIHSFQNHYIWTLKNIKNIFFQLPTFKSLIIAFGISSFCMEGLIVSSIPIYESMKRCNYQNYKKILILSMVCFVVSYSLFAVLSCLEYSTPNSVILLNFDKYSIFYCVVAYFCCLQIFFTYPLVFYVVYILCEQSTFGAKYMDNTVKQYTFRILLILSTVVVAIFVPEYGAFLSFLGCIGNAATIFWIPSACYLMRYHKGFGIIWLNCFLCRKCIIPQMPNFDYIMIKQKNDAAIFDLLFLEEQYDELKSVSCIGKYIALSVLIIGILCSIIGIYISILEEI